MSASFADHEIWHVLTAGGGVSHMNVDQLDDAFRRSRVDASTLVWKAGMHTWQRLGAVAGLDEDEETMTIQQSFDPQIFTIASLLPPEPTPRPAPRRATSPAPGPALNQRQLRPSPPAWPSPRAAHAVPADTRASWATVALGPAPRLLAPDVLAPPRRAAPAQAERTRSPWARRGRWLVGSLLALTLAVASYEPGLLREGARILGFERELGRVQLSVGSWWKASASPHVERLLTRLPSQHEPRVAPAPSPATTTRLQPAPTPTPAVASPAPSTHDDGEAAIVSIDALPVLDERASATAEATTGDPSATSEPDAAQPSSSDTLATIAEAAEATGARPNAARTGQGGARAGLAKRASKKTIARGAMAKATRAAVKADTARVAAKSEAPAAAAASEPAPIEAKPAAKLEPKAGKSSASAGAARGDDFLKAAIRSAIAKEASGATK